MGGYAGSKLTNLFADPAQTKLRTCCAEIYVAGSRESLILRLRGRRPILWIPSTISPDEVQVRFSCINGLPRSAIPKGLRQIPCILYALRKVHSGCCNCVAVTDLVLWGTHGVAKTYQFPYSALYLRGGTSSCLSVSATTGEGFAVA